VTNDSGLASITRIDSMPGAKHTEDLSRDRTRLQVDYVFNQPVRDNPKIIIEIQSPANQVRVAESWFSSASSAHLLPDATQPGFKVGADPEYTIYNDFDTAMGIRALQFLVNVPRVDDDLLFTPGMLPGFGAPLPDFVLAPHSSLTLSVEGMLDPGLFLYARGLVFDDLFTVERGDFVQGHQQPVPEPATLLLVAMGVGVCAGRRISCRA
jgi:PEP-CTERM motif